MDTPKVDRNGYPPTLAMQLGMPAAAYAAAAGLAAKANDADFPWHPALDLPTDRFDPPPEPLAVAHAALRRLTAAASGLRKWQNHPYFRDVPEPPVVWQAGSARLLDYGRCAEATKPEGPPVLVVPSLINRPYILDLQPEYSFLRFLAAQGLRPLLLDWGIPDKSERDFELGDYVRHRLEPAFEFVKSRTGRAPALIGYCLGGTLAAGLLATLNGEAPAFVTLGAPWDFSRYSGNAAILRNLATANKVELSRILAATGESFGYIPAITFQSLFAFLDPMQAAIKFRKFDEIALETPEARKFVCVENWLADAVPVTVGAAKNVLLDWQVSNSTALKQWRIDGRIVDPEAITIPSLMICGSRDMIAPPSVVRPLADEIAGAQVLEVASGHVGMIIGRKARCDVWQPVVDFLGAAMRVS